MPTRIRQWFTNKRSTDPGCAFEDVLHKELLELETLRRTDSRRILLPAPKNSQPGEYNAQVYAKAYDSRLAGLAFSGGGIRSATFNLGVIQALARRRLLSEFDYLSTVSGGGYIGAWLSAFLRRSRNPNPLPYEDQKEVPIDETTTAQCEVLLKPHPFKTPADDGCTWSDAAKLTDEQRSGFDQPRNCGYPPSEHAAVRFLRRYSNYLTPRKGLSGDTLALISLFLRNLVLMQIALALLVAVVLTGVFVFVFVADWYGDYAATASRSQFLLPLRLAMGGLIIAMVSSAYSILRYSKHAAAKHKRKSTEVKWAKAKAKWTKITANWTTIKATWTKIKAKWTTVKAKWTRIKAEWTKTKSAKAKGRRASLMVNLFVVLPATVSAFTFVLAVSQVHEPGVLKPYGAWIWLPAGIYFAIWMLGLLVLLLKKDTRSDILDWGVGRIVRIILTSALAAAALGGLLWLAATVLAPGSATDALNPLVVVTVGPPAMLMVFSFAVTVHMFLARRAFSDGNREWWARLGGFILLVALTWLLLFAIALFSWPLITWLGNGGFALLATWVSGSALGAWLSRKPDPETQSMLSEKARQAVAKLAPLLFVLGLVVFVAYLLVAAMFALALPDNNFVHSVTSSQLDTTVAIALDAISDLEWRKLGVPAVVLLVAFFISTLLDGNLFSLHTMYKHRLTRAYLGASNEKAADLNEPPASSQRNRHPFTGFSREDDLHLRLLKQQRPIPLINATINMTGGDELAWQARRAAAFCFTPYHTGYEAKKTDGVRVGQYRRTEEFADDITLGTAFAVSGAAASPNMGYHTSPSIAALLTAFNLRLGYWAGNVKHETAWQKASPLSFLSPLFAELTGSASGVAKWVNLTDGGHFDNLGIYELVRRRCRLIVATDVGCDPDRKFTDLANTVRKCWTDFGVHIQFDSPLTELHLCDPDEQISEKNALVGLVEYPVDDSVKIRQYGVLVYLKATLTPQIADHYPDIRQYADTHSAFPHETTADQFFDEEQFEAYRHLGFRIAQSMSPEIEKYFYSLADHPDKLAEKLVDKINASRPVKNPTTKQSGMQFVSSASYKHTITLDTGETLRRGR